MKDIHDLYSENYKMFNKLKKIYINGKKFISMNLKI